MMAEDNSNEDETVVEQPVEVEGTSVEQARRGDLVGLMSRFLESPGNVLLIQGAPGTGKTTLALELLNEMKGTRIGSHTISANKVYVSSRVSPTKLRRHFPGVREVIDSMSGKESPSNRTRGDGDALRAGAANIVERILALKRARQRGIIVIDSWEGAVANATEEERRALGSAVFLELDESKLSAVIVSESEDSPQLDYLVDGIVTLSLSRLEGRTVRGVVVNKLRGFRLQTQGALFSLDAGKFTLLPRVEFHFGHNGSAIPRLLSPVRNTEDSYSTGSPDLDALLDSGIRKGSTLLLDVNSTVSPHSVKLLLDIMAANFINQGGTAFIIPYSIFSSQNVAESLKAYVGESVLKERVRIAEFNQSLPDEKWRVKLTGKFQEDLAVFNSAWNELGAISSARVMKYDFDKAAQLYGENLMLPGLAELGAGMRDSGALSVGVISRPTNLREELLRAVDYHLKMQTVNGSLLIYGVKPITNVHGVRFGFERGYPRLSLTEIV
ncbi:AAA family ATPase [Candidatus Bathyarchaeota archaeon]|nr:MAG: AAA family ATPase [Candidatus Bathyarchaeota archaeon]